MKKTSERLLSFFLAIALIFGSSAVGLTEIDFNSLFAVRANAASWKSGTTGDCTWDLSYDGTLTISGKGSMGSYSSATYIPWYNYRSDVISVVVEQGVTNISSDAFASCTNLASVAIPNSVKYIGGYAFDFCTSLKSIALPDSIESIGSNAFYQCSSLEKINIPNSVSSIGASAFSHCDSLFSITIPDSVTYIGEYAFSYCSGLTSFIIPDSVTSINLGLFSGCDNLTSVTIPDSVTSIGEYAFTKCNSLTNITIPDSVASIGKSAFRYCDCLESISIPYGVTSINEHTFMGCSKLESITIPGSMTSIGAYAFSSCDNLKYVFYGGSQSLWSSVTISSYNSDLTSGCIHYNSTGHAYSDEWTIDVAPTCTADGSKSRHCIVCDHKGDITAIDASGHSSGDWVIDISPTCTKEGSKSRYCGVCGIATETETIPCHVNTIWITEQEPTCVEIGYKDLWCLDCGEIIETEDIPVVDHNYGDWVIDTAPTCIEDGTMHQICSGCGAVKTGVAESKGHSHSTEWTIDLEPTCTEEGSKSHHCTICGDKVDVTVIEPLGHDYTIVSTEDAHPHLSIFKCSRCSGEKQEGVYSPACVFCNFSYDIVDDETCKITGYIGTGSVIKLPGFIDERVVVTTATGAFKNNTTVTSVIIEDGVQSLGALAFLGCTSLSKVVIPESVTSIGTSAFHNCANGFTIYCYRNTYAMQYAIDNSHNYVIMDIGETDTCSIDYENKWIFSSVDGITSLNDVIYVPSTSSVSTEASLISGTNEFFGTGSKLKVTDNGVTSEYTLIVNGDTNGDSVCDALDAAQVICVANGQISVDGAYKMAADGNSDDVIDIADYQAVINKAVS